MKLFFTLFKILVVLVILLFALAAFLILTKTGNNILKPYVQSYINTKVAPSHIEITEFNLDSNNTNVKVVLNDIYNLNITGKYSIFNKTLDLKYNTNTTDKEMFALDGKIAGNINTLSDINIDIDGSGYIFKSKTSYKTKILSTTSLDNTTAKITNLNTKNVFKMFNLPNYASSNIDVNVNSKSLKDINSKIELTTKINSLTPNATLIKQEYNVSLPSNFIITGGTKHAIANQLINSNLNINSSIAKINSTNITTNLKTNISKGDMRLYISDLQKLKPIINKSLNGSINIDSNFTYDKVIFVQGTSDIAKSNTNFTFKKNILELTSNNILVQNLLYTLGQKELFESNAKLDLKYNTKTSKGNYSLAMGKGNLTQSTITNKIKSYTGLDLTKNIYDNGYFHGNISNKLISIDGNISNTRNTIAISNSSIYPENKTLDASVFYAYKKDRLKVNITGNIADPKVRVDVKDLLNQGNIKDKIQAEANRFIEKNIKIDDNIKDVLKNQNINSDTVNKFLNILK
ncbi:MAG: Putative outer membrane protein [uncultured Campylobacterales bacterium]|uniref:Outer membrane protein n=1 Tax=uncultured Campylobacterales bacterium TaxID=352960 RepID=A0A6S6SAL8_9BACT|nr:MAG: Putative outer membrane protein [uncultured Campylobacterales bacterium]